MLVKQGLPTAAPPPPPLPPRRGRSLSAFRDSGEREGDCPEIMTEGTDEGGGGGRRHGILEHFLPEVPHSTISSAVALE